MKKLKWVVGAFLLWEISTLIYKDKSFKSKLEKKQWFDKVKFLFQSLVDLNKKLFYDVKDYDYEGKIEEFKVMFENEKKDIENKIKDLSKQALDLKDEKMVPVIKDIEKKVKTLKKWIENTISDLDEKYDFEDKIDIIVKKVNELKKKTKKKVKSIKK